MTEIRSLRFAGSFFPGASGPLRDAVVAGLRERPALTEAQPQAVLSAHAGYRFSGRFTGMALAAPTQRPGRVVILSPSHRYGFDGIGFPTWQGFDTGLGVVPIDRAALKGLAQQGLALAQNAAHDNEHGIETQLPFLATRWPGVPVVPLVIGNAPVDRVARVIDHLAEPGTLFVLSSDLSHFLEDQAARQMDAQTAVMIERGEGAGISPRHACGSRAVAGWLASRTGQGTKALRQGMGNSADVTGDRGRVVGYGAWAFYGLDQEVLAPRHRDKLLRVARQAVEIRLRRGREPALDPESFAAPLQGQGAAFVTLSKAGRLRGCIGSLAPHRPLMADVVINAQKAALHDPRFPPVTAQELPQVHLKIAVLTRAARMDFASETEALEQIVPGQDGLILTSGQHRGTFLPQVWESIPEPADFLRALKRKAGLSPDYWSDDLTLSRYRAESFGEA